MADTLDQIEQQVTSRLRELEPLVEEYRQLQLVAESLKAKRGGTAQPTGGGTRSSRAQGGGTRSTRSGGPRRRAPRGQNRERILALVGERPGITNREIADTTGIGRRVVATAISKYKRDGLLTTEGSGVKLADGAGSTA
ncbi:MAG TPA: winged helix-turn-helix domain-containing protein [Solirubrobacteraceae bacterium]